MAKYSRLHVAEIMFETGIVPLFYNSDIELGKQILLASYNGGARLLEFTARGDFAFEAFSELNKYALKELPGMIMGVGSITDAGAASLYIQMGANFVVTPTLRKDIAKVCNRRKVLWSPGCGSLTEINKAEEMGCEVVKLFPGATYGPDFVKAIRAPQPWTNIMPTGGVTTEDANIRSWFDAGAFCLGMGSQLISNKIVETKDFKGLENEVRKVRSLIDEIRKS